VTPRDPPAPDVADYVARSRSAGPSRFEARVTLQAPAEAIRTRAPAGWGTVEPIDERRCEYRTGDDELHWLALRLIMLGVDLEVHEPPELVVHLRELSARLERAARPPVLET
jgi:predicted DNA-binding transcriptional regulator YafY